MDPEKACDISSKPPTKLANAAGHQDAPLVLATTSSDVNSACVRQSELKNRQLLTLTVEGGCLYRGRQTCSPVDDMHKRAAVRE